MSWLFDRLCALAGADRVEIIVDSSISGDARGDDSNDFADVLLRAAHVPQLTVWVLASRAGHEPGQCEVVDLSTLGGQHAQSTVRRLLAARELAGDIAIHVELDTIALEPSHRGEEALRRAATDTPDGIRRLLATDRAGHTELFERLKEHGLGVAIGGVDPQATVQVSDLTGAVSIIDALVTLRTFAFGANAVPTPVPVGQIT